MLIRLFWLIGMCFSSLQNLNETGLYGNGTFPPDPYDDSHRRKRSADLSLTTSPPAFTASLSDRTMFTSITTSSLTLSEATSSDPSTNTDPQLDPDPSPDPDDSPTTDPMITDSPSTSGTNLTSLTSMASETDLTSASALNVDHSVSVTSDLPLTSAPSATPPPWLTHQSQTGDMTSDPPLTSDLPLTSDPSPLTLSPAPPRFSTRAAGITGHSSHSTRKAVTGTPGGRALMHAH